MQISKMAIVGVISWAILNLGAEIVKHGETQERKYHAFFGLMWRAIDVLVALAIYGVFD